jgi:oxalate decarboxylase
MTSEHVRSLLQAPVDHEGDEGSIRVLTADTLPTLRNLSLKRIVLAPDAIREPQWNVNANQLAYVLSGEVYVSILGNADAFSSFVVRPGQMYHVESGAIYHIENISRDSAEIIVALRHERPQHFSLRGTFNAMTEGVLGNTYDLPASVFKAFDRSGGQQIARRIGLAQVPSTAGRPNANLFDIEGQNPPLSYATGQARMARKQFWAALDDISMYSLTVRENGMREIHWHPETAEMGYVARGRARMRILDPDGALDEYELAPGDVYFVPRAYPHHIEVLGEDGFHFLIFFDQSMPADIGLRASASAFSRPVLAAAFSMSEKVLPEFPYTPVDPLIVGRLNPTDPPLR